MTSIRSLISLAAALLGGAVPERAIAPPVTAFVAFVEDSRPAPAVVLPEEPGPAAAARAGALQSLVRAGRSPDGAAPDRTRPRIGSSPASAAAGPARGLAASRLRRAGITCRGLAALRDGTLSAASNGVPPPAHV